MTKIERVRTVLAGRQPYRPPLSFWYHFGPDATFGPKAVEAHVRHLETYDLDFLKVMDDNRYPRPATPSGVIASAQDLTDFHVLQGDEAPFDRQLELLRRLAEKYTGQVLMATTVFNSWTTLRNLTMPEASQHGPPTPLNEQIRGIRRLPIAATGPRRPGPGPGSDRRIVGELRPARLGGRGRWCVPLGPRRLGRQLGERRGNLRPAGSTHRPEDPGGRGQGDFQHPARMWTGPRLSSLCRLFGDRAQLGRLEGPSIAAVVGQVRPTRCGGLDHLGTLATGLPEDRANQARDALGQAGWPTPANFAGMYVRSRKSCPGGQSPRCPPGTELRGLLQKPNRGEEKPGFWEKPGFSEKL